MRGAGAKPLSWYQKADYDDAVKRILESMKLGSVPVINFPMGAGKSTILMHMLAAGQEKNINLIIPSIALAK